MSDLISRDEVIQAIEKFRDEKMNASNSYTEAKAIGDFCDFLIVKIYGIEKQGECFYAD